MPIMNTGCLRAPLVIIGCITESDIICEGGVDAGWNTSLLYVEISRDVVYVDHIQHVISYTGAGYWCCNAVLSGGNLKPLT